MTEFRVQMRSIAGLLIENECDSIYKENLLNSSRLDYSVDSLEFINEYLDKIRLDSIDSELLNKIYLRCGSYVGEVILENTQNKESDWIYYENACKINPSLEQYGKSLATYALLYYNKSFYFPINKVIKYINNGREDNLRSFAVVIIDQLNEKK